MSKKWALRQKRRERLFLSLSRQKRRERWSQQSNNEQIVEEREMAATLSMEREIVVVNLSLQAEEEREIVVRERQRRRERLLRDRSLQALSMERAEREIDNSNLVLFPPSPSLPEWLEGKEGEGGENKEREGAKDTKDPCFVPCTPPCFVPCTQTLFVHIHTHIRRIRHNIRICVHRYV